MPTPSVFHVQALIACGCSRQQVADALAAQCLTFEWLLSAPHFYSGDDAARMPASVSAAGTASERLLSLKAVFATCGCCHGQTTIVCRGTCQTTLRVRTALAAVLVQRVGMQLMLQLEVRLPFLGSLAGSSV